ncbi:MarR family winged helix-turn-helix transcriptional regulator [Chenggangzhangella methanolivorans]|uniref:MarR family transcriptional regulator n=1 Tax=Chenggangzhangella methanolivorans TaxID=1437009 RepID=A0A9E6R8U7_9HYPH|nr:MarR family transcriptional regulator [Chenggangzhangella methanolivorans]QZN98943.1 MarR family transcriptional regulator [Chenggangzhangella methanolivorans]
MSKPIDPADAAEFGYQLAFAARRWRRELDDALGGSGLTDASWRPLVHLGRLGEGARQSDLARSLGIEGPSLVRLLDRLAAAGFLERREDASDRRAKTLHLTPEGRRLVDRLRAVVADVCAAMVEDVAEEDFAACMRVFARLGARAEKSARDAA